jgi:hypothetical protein
MPSVSPSLRQALTDSSFVFDARPKWVAEYGLSLAHQLGVESEIAPTLRHLQTAASPAPNRWFAKRLPVLWTMFMAARNADPRALTIWMAETARLLSDLPHDIAAHSIDEAIKVSRHGFLPSVGEIRGIADPLRVERDLQIERLREMVAALEDPGATARRAEQRRVDAIRAEEYARERNRQIAGDGHL